MRKNTTCDRNCKKKISYYTINHCNNNCCKSRYVKEIFIEKMCICEKNILHIVVHTDVLLKQKKQFKLPKAINIVIK